MASNYGNPADGRERFGEVLALLENALSILDEVGACASIGARLQEVIDDVRTRLAPR